MAELRAILPSWAVTNLILASFLDSTKSALEMAAVANSCDLEPPSDGLLFPPVGTHELASKLKPESQGGLLEKDGTVEVVSCLNLNGSPVKNDLRWGVYVVIEAGNDYQRDCFAQYGLKTDASGRYAATYKPYHFIGLELGISIASIMLRGEPTGQVKSWRADVVATAKRDLQVGEKLDGEGGHMVVSQLLDSSPPS
jgi:predicted homoserine dehydrogenase-like protein